MNEIKKGIPLPTSRGKSGRPSKYRFYDMHPGDCFDTDIRADESVDMAVTRLRNASTSYRVRNNTTMAFTVRAVEEEGKTVVRVWARESVAPVKRDEFGLGLA